MRSTTVISRPFLASIVRSSATRPTSFLSRPLLSASAARFVPLSNRLQPFAPTLRYNSSLTAPQTGIADEAPKPQQPSYQLTFTCKPCSHRSSHQITKQGYHHGTVLITCPNCKNRHVISDHLRIFMDEKSTLEDILQRKAAPGTDLSKLLKKGKLGIRQEALVGNEGEEDIEFWEDGTESVREMPNK